MPAEVEDRRAVLVESLKHIIGSHCPARTKVDVLAKPRRPDLLLDGTTLHIELETLRPQWIRGEE
jgi:hypothetical protein